MKRVIFVFQVLLKLLILFLLSFIWVRYFVRSFWLSSLISLGISVVFCLLTRAYSTKKTARSSLKLKEQTEAENTFLTLAASDDKMKFFYDFAKKISPSVEKKGRYFLLNRAEKNKIVLYPLFKFSELSPDDVAQIASETKKEKAQKIVVFCGSFSAPAQTLAKSLSPEIAFADKYSSFALYKEYDAKMPKIEQSAPNKKATWKEVVAMIFNKNKAKSYLLCAGFLLLSSIFIKPSLYFSIFASILLIFALVAYSNPSQEKSENLL